MKSHSKRQKYDGAAAPDMHGHLSRREWLTSTATQLSLCCLGRRVAMHIAHYIELNPLSLSLSLSAISSIISLHANMLPEVPEMAVSSSNTWICDRP